jgi:hypothetical protein
MKSAVLGIAARAVVAGWQTTRHPLGISSLSIWIWQRIGSLEVRRQVVGNRTTAQCADAALLWSSDCPLSWAACDRDCSVERQRPAE